MNNFYDQIINGPTPTSVLTFAVIGFIITFVAVGMAAYEIVVRVAQAREAHRARLREERAAAMRRHPSGRRLRRKAEVANAAYELPQWLNTRIHG